MNIIKIDNSNSDRVVQLIADFRVLLSSFKGISSEPDILWAKEEIEEFLDDGFPVFAAEEDGELIGYIVLRLEGPCVWVEHIYVKDGSRRSGVGSKLFEKAEETAKSFGGDTVFNWVHPNNETMIGFLRSKGYSVLNMIEIRRPYKGEKLSTTIRVEDNVFDY